MGVEKMVGFVGLVVVSIIGFLIFTSIFGFHYETGRGNHSGYITAVQKQGLFFKTNRAYVKTDLSSSQEDIYCVEGDDVLEKLEQMAENKEKGTFQYKSYFAPGITHCKDEGDIIYGVKAIK